MLNNNKRHAKQRGAYYVRPSRRAIVYTQSKHSFGDGDTESMSAGQYVFDEYIRYLHSFKGLHSTAH